MDSTTRRSASPAPFSGRTALPRTLGCFLSVPSNDVLEEYTTSEGIVRPKIDLISLNRERSDCDVDVQPNGYLVIVGRVLN